MLYARVQDKYTWPRIGENNVYKSCSDFILCFMIIIPILGHISVVGKLKY